MSKKQLRRCANCQKAGHNISTCATLAPEPIVPTKSTVAPLKFFVHHVSSDPAPSPHIVDLKKDLSPLWSEIDTATATQADTLFQGYHRAPMTTDKRAATPVIPVKTIPSLPLPFFEKPAGPSFFSRASKHFSTLACSIENFFSNIELPNFSAIFLRFLPTKGLVATAFLLVALLVLPGPAKSYYNHLEDIKSAMTLHSLNGFMALQDSAVALRQANLSGAKTATAEALKSFNSALATLGQHGVLDTLAKMIPTVRGAVASRENILLAGQEIALGNSLLFQYLPTVANEPSGNLLQKTNTIIAAIKTALPEYQRAREHLAAVAPNTLPLEYQNQFADYKILFNGLVHDSETIANLGNVINEVFGGNGARRYLLIFQNPSELRPTGGFMGSFAIMDIKNGEMINLEVPPGGTYDVQGQLQDHLVPPTPLHLSNKRWEFQDANWFADFPTSAEKMIWFYEHSRGVSTDGVIAINSSILERILSVLGPITSEKRGLTLTANSALPALQTIVEEGPEKQLNKPKQILTDLAPQFLESIKNVPTDKMLALLENASEALEQKELQAYFVDKTTEENLRNFGWAGHIIDTVPDQDYLLIVNTNIQGQKSDSKIHQTISHQAVVAADGTITDNVVITRAHSGSAGEKLYGQTNVDYLRLYVPEGSALLSAGGFTWPEEKNFRVPDAWAIADPFLALHEKNISIDQNSGTNISVESGKTVFGNWVITEPGETSQVQFTYRLPFTLSDIANVKQNNPAWQKLLDPLGTKTLARYQLVVQKQSGITSDFESQIIFPELWHSTWESDPSLQLAKNGAVIVNQPLIKDTVWALLMKK